LLTLQPKKEKKTTNAPRQPSSPRLELVRSTGWGAGSAGGEALVAEVVAVSLGLAVTTGAVAVVLLLAVAAAVVVVVLVVAGAGVVEVALRLGGTHSLAPEELVV